MNRSLPTFDEAEQRNKLSHFTVQGYDLHGVMHGGSHDGEECYNYLRMGIDYIIGFDPLESAFKQFGENMQQWIKELGRAPAQWFGFQLALGNKNSSAVELQVAAGDGKGSSTMDANPEHPEVKANWNQGQDQIVDRVPVEMQTFKTWYAYHKNDIDLANYDTLVLDTQGNEFDILQGMGDLLKGFKYLCIELSEVPVYKGEKPGAEVAAWLKDQGFTLDSPIYAHNDSFFVRSDIKPESDQTYRGRC